MGSEARCLICAGVRNLERHHVFEGSRRSASEKYGAVVWLCHDHHMAIHNDAAAMRNLKRAAQRAFEAKYSHEKFMEVFKKNYL